MRSHTKGTDILWFKTSDLQGPRNQVSEMWGCTTFSLDNTYRVKRPEENLPPAHCQLQQPWWDSIHQNYLSNPITITCGHDFYSCHIQQSWGTYRTGSLDLSVATSAKRGLLERRSAGKDDWTAVTKCPHITRSKRPRQQQLCLCRKHNQVLTLLYGEPRGVCPLALSPLATKAITGGLASHQREGSAVTSSP